MNLTGKKIIDKIANPMKNNVMDKEIFDKHADVTAMSEELHRCVDYALTELSWLTTDKAQTLDDVCAVCDILSDLEMLSRRVYKQLRYAARIASGQYSSSGLNTLIYEVQSAANELEVYLDLDSDQLPDCLDVDDSSLKDAMKQLKQYVLREDLLYLHNTSTGAELDFDMDDCTDADAVNQYFYGIKKEANH